MEADYHDYSWMTARIYGCGIEGSNPMKLDKYNIPKTYEASELFIL